LRAACCCCYGCYCSDLCWQALEGRLKAVKAAQVNAIQKKLDRLRTAEGESS
jgi:hypothetical protein